MWFSELLCKEDINNRVFRVLSCKDWVAWLIWRMGRTWTIELVNKAGGGPWSNQMYLFYYEVCRIRKLSFGVGKGDINQNGKRWFGSVADWMKVKWFWQVILPLIVLRISFGEVIVVGFELWLGDVFSNVLFLWRHILRVIFGLYRPLYLNFDCSS